MQQQLREAEGEDGHLATWLAGQQSMQETAAEIDRLLQVCVCDCVCATGTFMCCTVQGKFGTDGKRGGIQAVAFASLCCLQMADAVDAMADDFVRFRMFSVTVRQAKFELMSRALAARHALQRWVQEQWQASNTAQIARCGASLSHNMTHAWSSSRGSAARGRAFTGWHNMAGMT